MKPTLQTRVLVMRYDVGLVSVVVFKSWFFVLYKSLGVEDKNSFLLLSVFFSVGEGKEGLGRLRMRRTQMPRLIQDRTVIRLGSGLGSSGCGLYTSPITLKGLSLRMILQCVEESILRPGSSTLTEKTCTRPSHIRSRDEEVSPTTEFRTV